MFCCKFYNNLFQDGGSGNAQNGKPLSAANAKLDDGASSPEAIIPGTKTTVNAALSTRPLMFIRAGKLSEYNKADSTLYWSANTSYIWGATSAGKNSALAIVYDIYSLAPSDYRDRFYAFPLRCLHSQ